MSPRPLRMTAALLLLLGACTRTTPMPIPDPLPDLEAPAGDAADGGREDTAPGPDTLISPDADTELPAPDAECAPDCAGLTCGWDGCGGSCGDCPAGAACVAGQCCVPACTGRECGPDGCGGSCGDCGAAAVCTAGACCAPACTGRDCGPDGCGGWCGFCAEGSLCAAGACLTDGDGDGVPDVADPKPADPDFPGTAEPDAVYAHTKDALYVMNVKTYQLDKVGDFQWVADGGNHLVTDIGIDRYGVLYAVTFEDIYVCSPVDAGCLWVGEQPEGISYNGLTLVPKGSLDPYEDTLVAISEDGGWFRLYLEGAQVTAFQLGAYGAPYTSAGDAYSIDGVGTFAAVHKSGAAEDRLVRVNPSNGHVMAEVGPITGYSGIFGLAGWAAKAFAFDKGGDVILVDTATGAVELLHATGLSWWGAGVRTVLEP
ncbi:MAG: hypothetical protein FJ098_02415 [Deltaproteobacteria bacterium]|nr:hypothetical protein [Deltaproteobacteria bacterium]